MAGWIFGTRFAVGVYRAWGAAGCLVCIGICIALSFVLQIVYSPTHSILSFPATSTATHFLPIELYVCKETVTVYTQPNIYSEHITASKPHYYVQVSGVQGAFYLIESEGETAFVLQKELCRE